MKIRVALAEDNYRLAQSIKEKLELFPREIEVRFIAYNGKELLARLAQDHAVEIILMDIEMPEMDGIEATAAITEKYPQIKVIMHTVFDDEQKIYRAIQAGSVGYLLKDEPPHKVYEAIKATMEGGASMSQSIMAKSLVLLRNPERITAKKTADYGLSSRELEVLRQISKGLNHREIATNLFISPATVRKHLENIYRKMNVNNKIQAVNKATENNLLG